MGVLIPGELAGNSTYVIECLSGIGQVLEAAGYHVLLLYESMGGAEACERYLREHLIAGVLTLSASSAPELVDRLAQNADCAVGYIGSPKENFACNVYANYPGYASELVERLQQAGKDKILLFCDQPFNMKDLQRCLRGKGIGMEKIEWHCRGKLPSTRWREEIAGAGALLFRSRSIPSQWNTARRKDGCSCPGSTPIWCRRGRWASSWPRWFCAGCRASVRKSGC